MRESLAELHRTSPARASRTARQRLKLACASLIIACGVGFLQPHAPFQTIVVRPPIVAAHAVSVPASQSGIPVPQPGFSGEWSSPDGIVHLRARQYHPTIGRFLQRDTFIGVEGLPASLNRYAYVHNNPVNGTDPSGHFPWVLLGGVASSVGAFLLSDLIMPDPTALGAICEDATTYHNYNRFRGVMTAIDIATFGVGVIRLAPRLSRSAGPFLRRIAGPGYGPYTPPLRVPPMARNVPELMSRLPEDTLPFGQLTRGEIQDMLDLARSINHPIGVSGSMSTSWYDLQVRGYLPEIIQESGANWRLYGGAVPSFKRDLDLWEDDYLVQSGAIDVIKQRFDGWDIDFGYSRDIYPSFRAFGEPAKPIKSGFIGPVGGYDGVGGDGGGLLFHPEGFIIRANPTWTQKLGLPAFQSFDAHGASIPMPPGVLD
jgi:RHS repeat-associated protein